MEASVAALPSSSAPVTRGWLGRPFVHPVVDYLFVGGAITFPIFLVLYFFPWLTPTDGQITIRSFLIFNGVHFAASTLRLYTKPGARNEFPFLSWGFPVVCLVAVGLGLHWPTVGRNITALYFTWSPYHYAAQTYGLAVMYAMRSGARLDAREKNQLWWVCLLPFLYAFFTSTGGGLSWFVSQGSIARMPFAHVTHTVIVKLLIGGMFLLPVSLFAQLRSIRGRRVPLISLVLPVTNGIWWLGTDYLNAWWWTAMLHSIQYLIIVIVKHVEERASPTTVPGRGLPPALVYGGTFYGLSFIIAVGIFFVVPLAYTIFGFTPTESFVMMTMVINLHHFIVDGFIWRAPRPSAASGTPPASMPVPI